MGKDKIKTGGQNKHLHSRISFLQQAATYLTPQPTPGLDSEKHASLKHSSPTAQESLTGIGGGRNRIDGRDAILNSDTEACPNPPLKSSAAQSHNHPPNIPPPPSARLISHLTLIAKKSQIRLEPSIKHQICKRCSTLLIEGSTCRKYVENLSRGWRKAHADVLVVECGVCGGLKRWAVGMQKQGKGKKGVKKFNAKEFKHKNDDKVDRTPEESSRDVGGEEDTDC